MAKTILLPFKGIIVYDGMLEAYPVSFGGGIKKDVKTIFNKYAYIIHQQLFPKNFVKSSEKLIIIPDGILSAIPFEALLTAEDEDFKTPYTELPYLLKKYSINVSFGFNYLIFSILP